MLCIVSVSVHSLCIVLLLFKFDGSSKLKKFDALIRVVTRSFMCFAPRDILAVKKELGHSTQCSHGKAKKVFSTTSSGRSVCDNEEYHTTQTDHVQQAVDDTGRFYHVTW